ncbi:hypothetical protein FF38_02790 [Lucilia cuprina]|uniref:Uncharacterized protein n=1 Tax=Lucilia cuprina TaxID=7375 RepID=A0A0L0BLR6_LUCCU|nr:hypothetical protein CVS40_11992 [Lucilia cuprina]KNC20996.1 hypothetical protein FF38_02790 [Lucilia cuprina]
MEKEALELLKIILNNRRGRGRSRTIRGGWRFQVPDVAPYQHATVWPQQNYNATYGQPPIVFLPSEYPPPTHFGQYDPIQYYDCYPPTYPQYEYNNHQYYNQHHPTYMSYPTVHPIPHPTLPSATTTPPLPLTTAPPPPPPPTSQPPPTTTSSPTLVPPLPHSTPPLTATLPSTSEAPLESDTS